MRSLRTIRLSTYDMHPLKIIHWYNNNIMSPHFRRRFSWVGSTRVENVVIDCMRTKDYFIWPILAHLIHHCRDVTLTLVTNTSNLWLLSDIHETVLLYESIRPSKLRVLVLLGSHHEDTILAHDKLIELLRLISATGVNTSVYLLVGLLGCGIFHMDLTIPSSLPSDIEQAVHRRSDNQNVNETPLTIGARKEYLASRCSDELSAMNMAILRRAEAYQNSRQFVTAVNTPAKHKNTINTAMKPAIG